MAVLAMTMPAVGAGARGKPAPPPPPPLTIDVASGSYAIQGDGSSYTGYTITNGVADGAYINSAGGLELDLTSGTRSMLFTLASQPSGAPSYCVPDGTTWTVHQISRFGFNVVDSRGAAVGIQSMGANGVPAVVSSGGTTAGYDIGAIINFLPDGADSRVGVFTLRFGLAAGTTLSRTATDGWQLEHDATDPILLQCTATANRGKAVTYDVGYYRVPFSLSATCNLGPSGSCQ